MQQYTGMQDYRIGKIIVYVSANEVKRESYKEGVLTVSGSELVRQDIKINV